MEPAKKSDLQNLVLEWQRPVYNLAHRMLGNEADAADATQEVFSRIFARSHPLEGVKSIKPWVFRVATNVVLNQIRDHEVRRRRERELALERKPIEAPDRLERAEVAGIVQEELVRLPADARALLVLHFYNGLSKTELAEVLSLPRTTVQSRIRKGLDSMRHGLQGCGQLALLPSLETVMKGTPALEVPRALSTSLLNAAVETGTGVTLGSGSSWWGFLMAKKLVLGGALVTLLAAGAGYLVGVARTPTDPGPTGRRTDAPLRVASSDVQELQDRHERTLAELDRVRNEYQRLLADVRSREASAEAERATARALEEDTARGVGTETGIDWQKFQSAFAKELDLLNSLFPATDDPADARDPDTMAPEEHARILEVLQQYMAVAQEARRLSDQPFFDERVFPELIDAFFVESLGLDEIDRADLMAISVDVLARNTADLDLDAALPTELLHARKAMIRDLDEEMRGLLPPGREERWSAVHHTAKQLLLGNLTVVHLAVTADGDRTESESEILERWREAYDLSEGQVERARGAAGEFLDRARALLERYAGPAGNVTLDPAERYALEQAMLAEQIRAEQPFREFFDPEQLKEMIPVAIELTFGEKTEVTRRRGMGF